MKTKVTLALVVLPYIVAPIVHDYKMYRFDKSIGKIPAPEGYEKVAQKKWFGLLWANGNHADYLVIAVFRGADDDRFIYNYFKKDFGLYCPEEEADAYHLIYKKTGGTYYWVTGEEAAEDNLFEFRSYIEKVSSEITEPLYFAVYIAQGAADSDFRTR